MTSCVLKIGILSFLVNFVYCKDVTGGCSNTTEQFLALQKLSAVQAITYDDASGGVAIKTEQFDLLMKRLDNQTIVYDTNKNRGFIRHVKFTFDLLDKKLIKQLGLTALVWTLTLNYDPVTSNAGITSNYGLECVPYWSIPYNQQKQDYEGQIPFTLSYQDIAKGITIYFVSKLEVVFSKTKARITGVTVPFLFTINKYVTDACQLPDTRPIKPTEYSFRKHIT